jgi:DNA polymerase-3 subunit beta
MVAKCWFEVDRAVFADAFGKVSAVASSRSGKEILRNVHLSLEGPRVVLQASDGEVGVRSVLDHAGGSGNDAKAMLPTVIVRSILSEAEGETIRIEITAEGIRVECGTSEWRLLSEDPADFPPVNQWTADGWWVFTGAGLRKLIRRTIFCVDAESSRFALGGVQVDLSAGASGNVTFVATDSRRLSVVMGSVAIGGDGEPWVHGIAPVVATKVLKIVESLAEGCESVDVAMAENAVCIRCGPTTVYGQLVQGRFPDWRKVVPKPAHGVCVPPSALNQVLRRAMIVRSPESVAVKFTFSNGMLTLAGGAAEIGAAKIQLPVPWDGEKITIAFDPRYFTDALRALDSQVPVEFAFDSGEDPAVLLIPGSDEFRYVVMPLSTE